MFLFSAGLRAQSTDLNEKAERARELVLAGKPEQAIPVYRELARALPDNPEMLMNLCIAEFKARHYRDAVGTAQAALKLAPGLLTANLFLGASYAELGENAQAVAPLESVIAAQSNDKNARLMLAGALLALNRFDDAVMHFEKAADLAPGNPKVWYGLGQSYDQLSEQASRKLEQATPESAYAIALAADAAVGERRYGTAFRYYRQALSIQASAKEAEMRGIHEGLAAVYNQTGHQAWAAHEGNLERKVPAPDCTKRIVECEFLAGRDGAVVQATRSKQDAEAYYWAAKAYRRLARQAYEHLQRLPPSLESHLYAARDYDTQGLYREAGNEWRAALTLSPDDAHVQTSLVWSLYRARDYEAALALLQDFKKKGTEFRELSFLYGAALLNLEKPESAIPYLEAAVRNGAQFLPAESALGQAFLRAGRAADAIPHLKTALGSDEDGSIHFELLRAYQVTGQTEPAKKALAEYQAFRKSAEENKQIEQGSHITAP